MYVVYIDSINRLSFFLSLKCVFLNATDVLFITIHPAVYGYLKKKGDNCALLTKDTRLESEAPAMPYNIGVVERYYSWSDSDILSYIQQVKKILSPYEDKEMIFLQWNSSFIFSQFIKSEYKNSQVIYFENSNFDKNAYVSNSGTNADLNIETILEKNEVEDRFLPQVEISYNVLEKIRMLACVFRRNKKYFKYKSTNIISRCLNFVFWNSFLKLMVSQNKELDYIFLPLQIKSDTNIICYYDYTISDFVFRCIKDNPGVKIVIKFHPKDVDFFWKIRLCIKLRKYVCISNSATDELIEKASKVSVINSTVGFESLIKGKKVDIYGRAYYQELETSGALMLRDRLKSGVVI